VRRDDKDAILNRKLKNTEPGRQVKDDIYSNTASGSRIEAYKTQ
jgi:hypothetical protein